MSFNLNIRSFYKLFCYLFIHIPLFVSWFHLFIYLFIYINLEIYILKLNANHFLMALAL